MSPDVIDGTYTVISECIDGVERVIGDQGPLSLSSLIFLILIMGCAVMGLIAAFNH